MKRIGLFLLKNNIHLMTLCFAGWAVWAAMNWQNLELAQKITMGMYALLIVHEYEEGYKDRFVSLMLGRIMKIDHRTLVPGITHIAQAVYITLVFSLALLFPSQLWLTFTVLILGLFEGFIHNWGIFMFRLHGPSPGWWTAVMQAAYAIWAIVTINKAVDYDGIQWLWAFLWFIGGFFCMDLCYLKMALGSPLKAVPHFKAFIKERFGRS